MTDEFDSDESLVDWSARLARVHKEHDLLYDFIHDGHKAGTITLEARRAYYRAQNECLGRMGLISLSFEMIAEQAADPTKKRPENDAIYCTGLSQAMHEGRKALLELQPELKAAMEREAPSSHGGRVQGF